MERLIVFVLVLLLPTQLAYHFWPQFSYVFGLRVDYLSPTIFLTDIIIILLTPYLISLINKVDKKKIKSTALFIGFLLCFSLVNIIIADFPLAAIFKWIGILKLVLLGTYFYLCDLKKLRKVINSALLLSLFIFSSIGILQFLFQKTMGGPLWLLGERTFASDTPGIALMDFFGRSLMRAYSTFPHPNSLAGFTVVSSFLILFFNSINIKKNKMVSFRILVFIIVLVLFLSASFSSFLGVLVVFLFFVFSKKYSWFVQKIKILLPSCLIVVSIIFGALSFYIPQNFNLGNSTRERITLAQESMKVFSERAILGVGLNNFFSASGNTQPPHNIFLLILSETGTVGILLIFFLLFILLNRNFNIHLFFALIFVLTTSLFDHYWFTLQQNQLLLSMLVGILLRKNASGKENIGKYNN